MAPFWCVKAIADSGSANLVQSNIVVKICMTCDVLEKSEQFVNIPVLTNRSAVEVGSELMVHDKLRAAMNEKKAASKKRGASPSAKGPTKAKKAK